MGIGEQVIQMIIDIVLGYSVIDIKKENELIRLVHDLLEEGYRVRIFQGYSSQYQNWMEQVPEIYYYAKKNYPEEEDYISYSMGYKYQIEQLGRPDIVIATQHPLIGCICRLGISFLGNAEPTLLFWPWEEITLNGEQIWLTFMDAHIVTHKEVGDSIIKCVDENQVVYLLEDSDTLENKLALKQIIMKHYYTKQSESYELKNRE